MATHTPSKNTGKKTFNKKKSFGENKSFGERKSYGDKPAYGERKSFGERKPYGDKPAYGERKTFGERKSYGDKPAYGERKTFGERQSYGDKPAYGERKSFGERRPYGDKPAYGERKSFGERKSYGDKPAYGERKSFGERKSYGDKPAYGERKTFGERQSYGDKPAYGERKSFGERKSYGDKPAYGERDAREPRTSHKRASFFEMANTEKTHQASEEIFTTPTGGLETNELMAIGRQSVQTILEVAPERIQKILFAGEEAPTRGTAKDLWQLAKMLGKRVDLVPKIKLDQMLLQQQESLMAEGHLQAQVESLYHQGVVAILSPQKLWTLESWHEEVLAPHENQGKPALVILCDSITDARNFGAILRVAEGAGAVGVIIGKHRSASFSVGVSKTACGADQTMPVIQVTNLSQAQSYLKELGFWSVGTVLDAEAQDYQTIDYARRTVLVLGSEDEGISKQLLRQCDFKAYIPMLGKVQSLNVATAAAVMAFSIQGQWRSASEAQQVVSSETPFVTVS